MAALTTALDGVCTVWTPEGGERSLRALDFILGAGKNALHDGELLRAIDLPIASLRSATAFRQISLTPAGRSAALLVGTLAPSGAFGLTVTAATRRPCRLNFTAMPSQTELHDALVTAVPDAMYYDDIHGAPDWRRHMTFRFAEQIRQEVAP
jgi:CO/xanthine dehydrogenase FAD-binding subunit